MDQQRTSPLLRDLFAGKGQELCRTCRVDGEFRGDLKTPLRQGRKSSGLKGVLES